MIKVLFFGNHDVGVSSLNTLLKVASVIGVVAHPQDPEDGVRYKSLYEFSLNKGLRVIRGKAQDKSVIDFCLEVKPQLIWVTDYRYLLSNTLINIPSLGAVNIHPSLLPRYRGRASLNWALINGEKEIGLTGHFIDQGTDTGDIIFQKRLEIKENENIGDILDRLIPEYEFITKKIIGLFKANAINRIKQDNSKATIYPARKPCDGLIKWTENVRDINNLVRAVAKPYPGAFTYLDDKKIYIWESKVIHIDKVSPLMEYGSVISIADDLSFNVHCKGGILLVKKWTSDLDVEILKGSLLKSKLTENE